MALDRLFVSQLNFRETLQTQLIRNLEARYQREYSALPINLSHWDPGEAHSRRVLATLRFPSPIRTISYLYGDDPAEEGRLLQALGFDPQTRRLALTPSATAASVVCGAFLQQIGVRRMHVVCPAYFASFRLAELLRIHCVRVDARYVAGTWGIAGRLPDNASDVQAVWITDPVFSTGQRWSKEDIALLGHLAEGGTWIVIDQALGLPDGGLHQRLAQHDNILGIHSPHKALCVNSFKFAAIVYDRPTESLFSHCVDVISGGLSLTNYAAVEHYLGANFPSVRRVVEETIESASAFLQEMAQANSHIIVRRPETGFFSLCVVAGLPATLVDELAQCWELMQETGASIIPGGLNRVPTDVGFSFRINLTRDSPVFRGALVRLLRTLKRRLPSDHNSHSTVLPAASPS